MALLILLLTWLSPVLPAMSSLPQPVNLNLTSHNFIHLLTWERGAGTPPGVTYRVSVVKITGVSWIPVAGCQNIVDSLLCNLTEAFSDPSETYLTNVTAHLESETPSAAIHGGFKPIRDTVLDLPQLSVAPCDRNLCVKLKPPLEHLRHVYEGLTYKLNVSANAVQYSIDSVPLDGHDLDHVAPGRQYCVSVCFSDPVVDRHSHHTQPVCVDTPGTFKSDVLVWSLLTVLMLCGVSCLAFSVLGGFICLRKRPLPSILRSLHHIEESLVLAAPCASSFAPLHEVKSTAPPVREKRSSSTSSSESSDEENTPESTGGGGAGLYLQKGGTNLPSSSSSSSSSLISAPSLPLSAPSNPPHSITTPPPPPPPPSPPPAAQDAAERAPLAGQEHTHSADRTPASHTVCTPADEEEEVKDSLSVNLLTLTFDREKEEEEEEEMKDILNVDLLTLTIDREQEEEEEEEEEEEWKRPEFSSNMNPFLPLERVTVETAPSPEDEDEEEEDEEEDEEPSGYIRH